MIKLLGIIFGFPFYCFDAFFRAVTDISLAAERFYRGDK